MSERRSRVVLQILNEEHVIGNLICALCGSPVPKVCKQWFPHGGSNGGTKVPYPLFTSILNPLLTSFLLSLTIFEPPFYLNLTSAWSGMSSHGLKTCHATKGGVTKQGVITHKATEVDSQQSLVDGFTSRRVAYLEDRNLLKFRSLDSSCPFSLTDNSEWGR